MQPADQQLTIALVEAPLLHGVGGPGRFRGRFFFSVQGIQIAFGPGLVGGEVPQPLNLMGRNCMKKVLSLVTAAVVALSATSQAQAQARFGLFDLGVYGGGAASTDWVEIGNEDFGPGLAPIFGATAGFFATPRFGLRLHFAYMPSRFFRTESFFGTGPDRDEDILFGRFGRDGYPLNNYFYDLDLVFRPFADPTGIANFLGATYFFIGGGGLTSDIAGSRGGFLNEDEDFAANTVGQGTVGLGFSLLPITSGIGLFAELAAHGYDSPVHVSEAEERLGIEDKFAVTTRLVAGLKFSFGGRAPAPVFVPAPAPAPMPAPAPEMQTVRVCVVDAGDLREVQATVNPTTGDTLVNGRPFEAVYPATVGYAGGQDFFIRNQPITVNRTRYVKFGLTRIVPADALVRAGEFQGVPAFRDRNATGTAEVLYVPVRPGCEFQTYQREQAVRGVRG